MAARPTRQQCVRSHARSPTLRAVDVCLVSHRRHCRCRECKVQKRPGWRAHPRPRQQPKMRNIGTTQEDAEASHFFVCPSLSLSFSLMLLMMMMMIRDVDRRFQSPVVYGALIDDHVKGRTAFQLKSSVGTYIESTSANVRLNFSSFRWPLKISNFPRRFLTVAEISSRIELVDLIRQ